MDSFEKIWRLRPDYSSFGLDANPFRIAPLFSDYNNKRQCEQDEKVFVTTKAAEQAAKSFDLGKRLLIWGEIGVGKSTIMNMLLYLGRFRDNCLPVRVVIKEDTIDRAVQELLYTYCFELAAELRSRSLKELIKSARKWLLERKYSDKLYDLMLRMMGPFEEEIAKERREGAKAGVSLGVKASISGEEATMTSLKSYVESLPVRAVQERVRELYELTTSLGYRGAVFAIDEADHVAKIDRVLSMLTVSREIFFSSRFYTFIVAGSPELIGHDSRGEISGIFDSVIQVTRLDDAELRDLLTKRIQAHNPQLNIENIFDTESLTFIIQQSAGVVKVALRLAENALEEATSQRASLVILEHVRASTSRVKSTLLPHLEVHELRVLTSLSSLGEASPTDGALQVKTELSRPRLTTILNELYDRKLVQRRKIGRKVVFSVPVDLRPFLR